jgi:hypothetical protein
MCIRTISATCAPLCMDAKKVIPFKRIEKWVLEERRDREGDRGWYNRCQNTVR